MARFWSRTKKAPQKVTVACSETVQSVTHYEYDYLTSSENQNSYSIIDTYLNEADEACKGLSAIVDSVGSLLTSFALWEGKSKDKFQDVIDENTKFKSMFNSINNTINGVRAGNNSANSIYNSIIETWENHKSHTESGNTIINHSGDINLM